MKNATLQEIVTSFVNAVPAVVIDARRFNGGACVFCRSPRGTQHDSGCSLWSLIDARIGFRVASEGPKTADSDRNRAEVMQALEGGAGFIATAPELEFSQAATASDEWRLS